MTTHPPANPPDQQWPAAPPPPRGYPAPAPPSRGPRPSGLDISFWLWITYLVIGTSNAVIGFIHRDRNRADAINAVIAQYPAMDRVTVEHLASAVVLGMVVIGLLFVAAGLSFALLMRGGRSWARVVLTVVGSLSILFLIGPVGTDLQALFQLALLVAAIVMMFQPPVSEWLRPPRPRL